MRTNVYRIKHKPTGLFYGPKRRVKAGETNLSENGKVYPKKPSYETSIWEGYYYEGKYIRTNISEWELITYDLVESERNNLP